MIDKKRHHEDLKSDKYQIITLGDGAVGKTSIIHRFLKKKFLTNYRMAMGTEKHEKSIKVDGKNFLLLLWDIASFDYHFRHFQNKIYGDIDGFLFVYDITRKESFDNIERWVIEVDKNDEKFEQKPVILAGNKFDLKGERNEHLKINQKMIDEKMKDFSFKTHFFTSAKTGLNVEEVYLELTRTIKKRMGG